LFSLIDHQDQKLVSVQTEINLEFMIKHLDTGTILVILSTIILFIVALFVKGLTHDILLEAGVLLVSIKLIMLNYKNSANHIDIKKDLEEIKQALKEKNQ
jgi:hypothetical protein